jgi:hypothetical protein
MKKGRVPENLQSRLMYEKMKGYVINSHETKPELVFI